MKCAVASVGLALMSVLSVGAAQATSNRYHITKGRVEVICLLTVGGSFEARTTAVVGDLALVPGSGDVTGAATVDLTPLATGIALRDRHMKEIYLDVGRDRAFATARLEQISIGHVWGRTPFQGTLRLHGQRHSVVGVADLQRQTDGGIRVQARFPISLAAFGIKPPSYLGAGVRDEINVQVTFTTAPPASEAVTPRF